MYNIYASIYQRLHKHFAWENYAHIVPEQAVIEEKQKWKKAYLTSVSNIAMRLYCSLAGLETTSLVFKEERWVEVKNKFLRLPCDTLQAPTGYENNHREIIFSNPIQGSQTSG